LATSKATKRLRQPLSSSGHMRSLWIRNQARLQPTLQKNRDKPPGDAQTSDKKRRTCNDQRTPNANG
jgi:hypothetical protein